MGALTGILSCDPRPAYQNDSNRIYGISFDNMNVKFKVDGDKLTVLEIENKKRAIGDRPYENQIIR